MLKALALFEILASVILLALAVWPFTEYCSGRFMGLDCESRAIFGVNLFAPLGLLALACSLWSLKRKSVTPQYILLLGIAALMLHWFSNAL